MVHDYEKKAIAVICSAFISSKGVVINIVSVTSRDNRYRDDRLFPSQRRRGRTISVVKAEDEGVYDLPEEKFQE